MPKNHLQKEKEITSPPGKKLIQLQTRSRLAKSLLGHFHLDKLPCDYAILWQEARSDEERREIWKEYRHELWIAVSLGLGIEVGLAGTMHIALANPLLGVSSAAFLIAILWLNIRR